MRVSVLVSQTSVDRGEDAHTHGERVYRWRAPFCEGCLFTDLRSDPLKSATNKETASRSHIDVGIGRSRDNDATGNLGPGEPKAGKFAL